MGDVGGAKSNYMTGSEFDSPFSSLSSSSSNSLLIGIGLGRCQSKGCDIKIATIFYAKQTERQGDRERKQKDTLRSIEGALIINVK